MNPAQSFYGYEDWHLPSPFTTPQATRSGKNLSHVPPPTETQIGPHWQHISHDQQSLGGTHNTTGGSSYSNNYQEPTTSDLDPWSKGLRSKQVGFEQDRRGQQMNTSHIASGSVEDFSLGEMATSASSSMQMHTPPPTRHSSKRKPQQPAMNFNVASSTAHSRRKSAPGEAWLKRNDDQTLPEASPFQFTPLQFSPVDVTAFPAPGPATAPAYPQTGLFWDPNSNMDLSSFSAITENPFQSTSQSQAMSFDVSYAMSDPLVPPHQYERSHDRSQSAHMFSSGPSGFHQNHMDSGVNPSMIWSTQQNPELGSLMISGPGPTNVNVSGRQPYQYYFEELRREKEERSRRQNARVEVSGAAVLAGQTLRRGLSQLRVSGHKGKKKGSTSSSEFSDPAGLQREGSPLKRHKSDAQERPNPSLRSSLRTSVVLEVDEKGRARTVVKTIPEDLKGQSSGVIMDDSDSSDGDRQRPNSSVAGLATRVPAMHNEAQDELRMMRDGRKRKEDTTSNLDSIGGVIDTSSASAQVAGNGLWSSISPDTITDPDLLTPLHEHLYQLDDNSTRCVCNNMVGNEEQFMVQCESCNKWLHVACLGLNPHQMPPVFVCIYCTGNTPTVRGGRVRVYPTHSSAMG